MRLSPLLTAILSIAGSAAPLTQLAAEENAATEEAATSRTAILQAKRQIRQAEEHITLGEAEAAIALYEKVIQRFTGHEMGFKAHLGMARLLFGQGQFEQAIDHYSRAASHGTGPSAVANPELEERTEALFHVGMCFVQLGQHERCFPSFRQVIAIAPGTEYANRAYFQIADAHYRSGNYTQAIANYRMVGTSLAPDEADSNLAELGKPLFVRIDDRDLLILDGDDIEAEITTNEGDTETIVLSPQLPGSQVYVGHIASALGSPTAGNGTIEGNGRTRLRIAYLDGHTAEGTLDVNRERSLQVVGDGRAAITDGAYRDAVSNVILDQGKGAMYLRVVDYDQDLGPGSESLEAEVIIERPIKPEDDLEEGEILEEVIDPDAEPEWEERGRTIISLSETEGVRRGGVDLASFTVGVDPEDQPRFTTEAIDSGIRTGVFTAEVPLVKADSEADTGDAPAVMVGDRVTVRYRDNKHLRGGAPINREHTATVVPGNVARLMLAGYFLNDANIKVRKELLQAETSLKIGEVYRDMGLEKHALQRFDDALEECRRVGATDGTFDRELREQTLYTLWRIFLAKGALREAAAACRTLQEEFPESDFIDDSLVSLGDAARAAGEYAQAIQLYQQVASLPNGSLLAPRALFSVGEVYQAQSERVRDGQVTIDSGMRQRAIRAYQQVFTQFPDSADATEALKRTGDLYFDENNYTQAIDFFQRVLREYPDAPFVADVLYNLARSHFLKGDYGEVMQLLDRIERQHPGYERLDSVRYLRQITSRRSRGG